MYDLKCLVYAKREISTFQAHSQPMTWVGASSIRNIIFISLSPNLGKNGALVFQFCVRLQFHVFSILSNSFLHYLINVEPYNLPDTSWK